MKRIKLVVTIIFGFVLLFLARMAIIAQEPYEYVVELGFDWDAGHKVITSAEALTITDSLIALEMRSEDDVVSMTQSIPGCVVGDSPGAGDCGSRMFFTVTLPYKGYWEEWVIGKFVFENGEVHTYSVPAYPHIDLGEDGFALVGILQGEWYDACPPDPTTLPTATGYPIQATYTVVPTPTCKPTAPPQATYTPRPSPTLYPTQIPYPPQP